MRFKALGIFVLFVSIFSAGAVMADTAWVGKTAPEFAVPNTDGEIVELKELVGAGVIWLNFWGLRCGPCVRELPALEALYQKYKDDGLVIIGVNVDGVDGNFIKKSFNDRDDLQNAKVTFPLVTDTEFALIDSYELMGAPLNVMIDRAGVVQYHHEGYEAGDEVEYEEIIKKLLAN